MNTPIAQLSNVMKPVDVYQNFRHSPGLGEGLPIAVLVKYQKNRDELVKHRQKFQTAQQNGRFASLLVPLRSQTWGGGFAAIMPLTQGLNLANARWCITGEEARGLSRRKDVTMVAMANELRLLDSHTGQELDRWLDGGFRNLHSVEFHPDDANRVLLANSGFDQIMEYDLTARRVVWQWQAWENGYHLNPFGLGLRQAHQPLPDAPGHRLLSREEAMETIRREEAIPGDENWWVSVDFNSVEHPLGLEKWLKGAEPNWAGYDPHGHGILATFFVASQAVCLDPQSGQVRVIKKAFGRPHGLVPWAEGYVISATRRGHATLLDHDFRTQSCYQFTTMPLPASYAESDGEWLQFTNPIGNGLLATVDSRRATVFVWDPKQAIYERYPFNRDWEVHSVMGYEES